MDIHFCRHYHGDGFPPTNRFCRECGDAGRACDPLWQCVLDLARTGSHEPVPVPGTRAVLFPNPVNRNMVRLRVNVTWNLPKEDFLHFIATGHAQLGRADQRHDPRCSPSLTRQEPYVQAIVAMLGGWSLPEIEAVRRVQEGP